ncbi:MAG: hypothetical protein Q4C42_01790 [Clostridia bacterium]|nr:hypothetical protein [Clostridia bacterium]
MSVKSIVNRHKMKLAEKEGRLDKQNLKSQLSYKNGLSDGFVLGTVFGTCVAFLAYLFVTDDDE